ncbi:hypothetical protein CEXT_482941 [Caerostris extrusa]|uniref:Uncharacterized protein n=1 Tax=Caerostris extrusa TaxID=172846 RepID=A0AAV4RV78_CAEEX|nr:hypothetical protein CEXT_482941 [Caerostris extrusa]
MAVVFKVTACGFDPSECARACEGGAALLKDAGLENWAVTRFISLELRQKSARGLYNPTSCLQSLSVRFLYMPEDDSEKKIIFLQMVFVP